VPEFDGVTERISISPTISFADGQPWTLNAWVYKDTGYDSNEFWIGSGGDSGDFLFQSNQQFYYRASGGVYYSFGSYASYTATWTLHTYVCNGTTIMAYINGSYVTTASPTTTYFYVYEIGDGYSSTTWPFAGKIPIVNIYNKELSTTEITQNYNAQKYRFV